MASILDTDANIVHLRKSESCRYMECIANMNVIQCKSSQRAIAVEFSLWISRQQRITRSSASLLVQPVRLSKVGSSGNAVVIIALHDIANCHIIVYRALITWRTHQNGLVQVAIDGLVELLPLLRGWLACLHGATLIAWIGSRSCCYSKAERGK